MAQAINLTSMTTVLAKLPQQRLTQGLIVLLLVYIAFLAAKITWLVVPQSNTVNRASTQQFTTAVSKAGTSFNLESLQALNLFGQYNAQVVEQKVAAVEFEKVPETRLQLTLSGLVASDKAEIAAAIIEHKKKQATYGIGDIIEDTRASLEQVLIDRVIIKHSGRLETLMLDGADYNQPAQSVSTKQASTQASVQTSNTQQGPQSVGPQQQASKDVVDQRSNAELQASAKQLRADLSNDPGKITDYLRISPARKDGNLVGYRLSPGSDPAFFTQSGLKSGDVAIQMNGFDLLAPLEAAQAMSALKTERDIALLVKRNEELIEILFTIE